MKLGQGKKGFDYKWVIVAVSFMITFIGLGFCSTPRSLFVEPITKALGIKRSLYALNDTCRFVASATINLFFSALVVRFGAKKLISAGIVSLIAATLCFAYGTNVISFCMGGLLLGIGFAWTTTTMIGSVVNRWCKKNGGTIMGAILAANGVGAAIAAQLFAPLIAQGTYGYRNAYMLTIFALLILLVLVIVFFKNSPVHTEGSNASGGKKKSGQWSGISFAEALKKPYFYVICLCVFITGLVLQGITGVAAAYISDVGLGAYAASVVSLNSLVLTFSKFFAGFSYDRLGLRTASGFCLVISVVALISLLLVTDTPLGVVIIYVYAVCAAFALPLETIMLPIYVKDLFGDKSYDQFLGLFVSINTVGYAVGGFVINLCYDVFGSYRSAFGICAVAMALVLVLIQYVIGVTNKMKKSAMQEV